MIRLHVPVRTVSEANAHEHWRRRQKRALQQRLAVWAYWKAVPRTVELPVVVRLTRVAPRAMDSDNAVGALKHVRDEIAELLGVDDGPQEKRVTWEYPPQEKGARNEYAVIIEVEPRPANTALRTGG